MSLESQITKPSRFSPRDSILFERSSGAIQKAIVVSVEQGMALVQWDEGHNRFVKLVALEAISRIEPPQKNMNRIFHPHKKFYLGLFLAIVAIAALIRYHHHLQTLRYCRLERGSSFFAWWWPCTDKSFDAVALETIRAFFVNIPQAAGESIGSFLRPCFGDSMLGTVAFLFCVSFVVVTWSFGGLFVLFASTMNSWDIYRRRHF